MELKFVEDTIGAISNINELSIKSEKLLVDYATEKAIVEFCRINQYYTFGKQEKNELRSIYVLLFSDIRTNRKEIESISKNHYGRLK